MRTLLICHEDAPLDREGLTRWLGSFSTLTGTVVLREGGRQTRRRIARQLARVGALRFLDVLAFRAHYALVWAARDRRWIEAQVDRLRARFPEHVRPPELTVASANEAACESFIKERQPDLVIARCKQLLHERIFSIPRLGTYAVHPGICPEYRNAHGCFWALANGDWGNIGATLLRIDRGIDTGPVYGHFHIDADPARESHVVIQHRAVLDHLDTLRNTFLEIAEGRRQPIDTGHRRSATWGQPWLSSYLKLRRQVAVT